MRTLFLLLVSSVAVFGQCGILVLNPVTFNLDCTGPAGATLSGNNTWTGNNDFSGALSVSLPPNSYDPVATAQAFTAGATKTYTPSATLPSIVLTPSTDPSAPGAGALNVNVIGVFRNYDGAAWRGMVSSSAGQDLTALATGFAKVTTTTGVVTTQATLNTADFTANAVTSAKMAVVNTRRTCSMVIGSDNGSVLADADIGPQLTQCKVPFAATAVEIDVSADAGTPNVIARRRRCTTFTSNVCSAWTTADLTSSALAAATGGFESCSKTTAVAGLDGGTTCAATLQNTALAVGDWIELKSGTAGGTAKRLSVSVTYTVD